MTKEFLIGPQRRLEDWTWDTSNFDATFGAKKPGRFAERWPSGIRIAVVLTFDTQGDVDAATAGGPNSMWTDDHINYADLTARRYDVGGGLDRVLRILAKHDVRATFPTCGLTAEWYPDAIRTIVDAGHEIAAHGHHHIELTALSETQERDEIERATQSLADVVGTPPKGWRSPKYALTDRTMDLLRDAGYVWNSDLHDADFPYVLVNGEGTIVEIPASLDDWSLYLQLAGTSAPLMGGTPYGSTSAVLSTLTAEFDVLYEESETRPVMMQLCMHPKISGRPFRAAVLDRFLTHVRGHDGARFMACEDLATLA